MVKKETTPNKAIDNSRLRPRVRNLVAPPSEP